MPQSLYVLQCENTRIARENDRLRQLLRFDATDLESALLSSDFHELRATYAQVATVLNSKMDTNAKREVLGVIHHMCVSEETHMQTMAMPLIAAMLKEDKPFVKTAMVGLLVTFRGSKDARELDFYERYVKFARTNGYPYALAQFHIGAHV